MIKEGGQGSGNFGHAGRPGKKGGSGQGTGFSNLSYDQKGAVLYYQEDGYYPLNYFLRHNERPENDFGRMDFGKVGEFTSMLDSAINEVLDKDTLVFRGRMGPDTLSVGQEFVDLAFVSTSYDSEIAEQFRAYPGETIPEKNSTLYKIKLPKGQKCLKLPPTEFGDQSEILLPRGTKFRVIGTEKDSFGTIYSLEVI